MNQRSKRDGTHPFDDPLAESWLLSWILPSWQVLGRQIGRIAPVALAYGVYVWLLPHLLLAGPLGGEKLKSVFDSIQVAFVLAAFMGVGYAVLARAEGEPYGLGYLAPTPSIAQRLALVTLFWLVFSLLLGWILRGVFSALAQTQSFLELAMWLFSKLGWWSIPFVLWLFSPIGFWLATISALTQIRAIRGDETIQDILIDSFQRVYADLVRIAVPAYILVAAAILIGYVCAELIFKGAASLFDQLGWGAVIGLAALGMALVLPFWFVIERVYLPEFGVEDDIESAEETTVAAVAAPEQSLSEQLAKILSEEDVEVAARRVANWVRSRLRGQNELAALMAQVNSPERMARELTPLVLEWSATSKPGELPWLVERGLALDAAFLMDSPDRVLALAKKLTLADRSDLATRLLVGFLKRHRAHADHLAAGLQLARVLATHSNNVDGARKLLTQLAQTYPDDPQPAQLIKQLGHS